MRWWRWSWCAHSRSHPRMSHACRHLPRQSGGKGCQKSICPWALWLSTVICVFDGAFEAIYPLHHSGVVPSRHALVPGHHHARNPESTLECRTRAGTCPRANRCLSIHHHSSDLIGSKALDLMLSPLCWICFDRFRIPACARTLPRAPSNIARMPAPALAPRAFIRCSIHHEYDSSPGRWSRLEGKAPIPYEKSYS